MPEPSGPGSATPEEPAPADPTDPTDPAERRVSPGASRRPPRRGLLLDLEPLRHSPAFARLWAGGAVTAIGSQMTLVAVGLHIYALTRDTFAVALVGVIALVPMLVFGLYGGMLADVFDRRRLALAAAITSWIATAGLAALAWAESTALWPLYLLTTVNAVSASVVGASRAAILPRLLPARLLPAASALGGVTMGASLTVGPMLAGLLVAGVGVAWTFSLDVLLFTAAFWGIATLPPIRPEGSAGRLPGLGSLREGWGFLRTAANVRAVFLIDIIAMVLGQPRVIFPAVGATLLGGGPLTVGILMAATAVGMLLSSVFSGPLGRVRRHGAAVSWAVAAYLACITAFGAVIAAVALTGNARATEDLGGACVPGLIAASIALAGSGAADNVSAIFRATIMQSAVPDAMRGRIQGLFQVVVTGGPRAGELYAGVTASVLVLWLPPLLGGLIGLGLVGVLLRATPSFLRYDALDPRP